MDHAVRAQGQLQQLIAEVLADPGRQPEPGLDLQGLHEVGLLQGEDLRKPPPEEGLLGLGALGELRDVPDQDRGAPEVVHDPAGGSLGQGGEGLQQHVFPRWALDDMVEGARQHPVGLQPEQRCLGGGEQGVLHG